MKSHEDAHLMARTAQGDLDAFAELVRRHQETAWRTAYRFLGDAAEAEDITQEAFLKILAAASRYQPRAAFTTYLYRVVAHLCIDHSRRKRPLPRSSLPEAIDHAPGPETALIQKDRAQQVRRGLDTLPPRQRLAIILKYYEGMRYQEIADVMEITTKAVERLLGRARTALHGRIEKK